MNSEIRICQNCPDFYAALRRREIVDPRPQRGRDKNHE